MHLHCQFPRLLLTIRTNDWTNCKFLYRTSNQPTFLKSIIFKRSLSPTLRLLKIFIDNWVKDVNCFHVSLYFWDNWSNTFLNFHSDIYSTIEYLSSKVTLFFIAICNCDLFFCYMIFLFNAFWNIKSCYFSKNCCNI